MRGRGYRLLLAGSAIACASALGAAETVGYSYDALGRLVRVERSGGPQSGVAASYGYDCAGNRLQVAAGAGAPPAPPPPPCPAAPVPAPPPPPPPANGPPAPADDSGAQGRCTTATYAVTANDTDPDGDYPLALISVTGAGFSIASTTGLIFTSGSATGNKAGTYTVRDARGATATAVLNVYVSGGSCS